MQSMQTQPNNQTFNQENQAISLDLFEFINNTLADWQIFRCQITHAIISQSEPMKFLYHYELLDDEIKANIPLNGQLLKQFDRVMGVEEFARLINIPSNKIKQSFQLKFYGKLVVFLQNPEVALRLHWTNTLKNFEIICQNDVQKALKQAFMNWQLVDTVEFINKTSNQRFVVRADDSQSELWQTGQSNQFDILPSVFAIDLQKFLMQSDVVLNQWFEHIFAITSDYVANWQENMIK